MAVLRAHAWPGNVRELQHVVEAAIVVCEGAVIRPDHLPASVRTGAAGTRHPQSGLQDSSPHGAGRAALTLEEVERAHIEAVLRAQHGHRGLAAKALGISERNLYRKLREWGLT
jgi:two-component system, NtrC family, response regulator HydG